jgi:uncharacterized SAM-binding protein YcdF (DUF218 family)
MFFPLSKIVGLIFLPSNFMFLLALAGILLIAMRWRRLGLTCVGAAVVLLTVFGILPAGNWLIWPLETRFPKWDASRGAPHGIVVLGGSIGPENSAARGEPALNESAERITIVGELARKFPAARIAFTGGNASLSGGPSEAEFAGKLFESFGVPRERLILEGDSRTTFENATFTRKLVAPKPGERWLLVTSAHHMPRSMGVFRQAGFPVEPYPVDWRTAGFGDLLTPFGSIAAGLARTDAAAHEWAGLLIYWVSGRSSELFPGPQAQKGGGCDLASAADNCRR